MRDQIGRSIREGKPILVFDSKDREGETDIVVASQLVKPDIIRLMRKDGGGLICTTLTYPAAEKLGIGYLADIFGSSGYPGIKYLSPNDIPYDEKSAFSITINHRRTFTGISDNDRALTIREFAKLLLNIYGMKDAEAKEAFGKAFRAPGHVHLLIARKGLLDERRGHTELSTSLMIMSGMIPSATIVEMLGDDGKSLSYEAAKVYATAKGYEFIEGSEIIKWWKEFHHN